MEVLYVILAILAFGLLILVHECGHFFAARACGVCVREFSLGMGPKLVSFTSKKTSTVYKICLFPIGGYVSMAGEEEASEEPGSLSKKPAWQRLIIMAAGAITNLLIGALIILLIVSALPGTRTGTTVGRFSNAERPVSSYDSGLREGDKILSIGGRRVHTGAELDYEIMRRGIRPVEVRLLRDGEEIKLSDVKFPTYVENKQLLGGRDFYLTADDGGFFGVFRQAFYRSAMTVRMVWESFFDLVTGRYGVDALSGPVGVAGAMSDAAKSGIWNFLYLVAVISLNLGVVNLFPLPALDGGHIVFVLWEMITKKPVPSKVENLIHTVGILLLFGLMILITGKDILQLFR